MTKRAHANLHTLLSSKKLLKFCARYLLKCSNQFRLSSNLSILVVKKTQNALNSQVSYKHKLKLSSILLCAVSNFQFSIEDSSRKWLILDFYFLQVSVLQLAKTKARLFYDLIICLVFYESVILLSTKNTKYCACNLLRC